MRHLSVFIFMACMSLLLPVSSTRAQLPAGGVKAKSRFLGPQLAVHSLANTAIGKNDERISIRFRARSSGRLESFRVYWIYRDTPGYHAGNGGTIRVSLRGDDRSKRHLPRKRTLAQVVYRPDIPVRGPVGRSKLFVEVRFPRPAKIRAGKLYHLQFENIDNAKSRNWISVNSLFNGSGSGQALPTTRSSDWALLKKIGERGEWREREGFVPILGLKVNADGVRSDFGLGYMESWTAQRHYRLLVSGNKLLRQSITPKSNFRASRLALYGGRVKGRRPLRIRIKDSAGRVLQDIGVRAGNFRRTRRAANCPVGIRHKCHGWARIRLKGGLQFLAGNTYFLEISSPGRSAYEFTLLRTGRTYGFSDATYFDGEVEQSRNAGMFWSGLRVWRQADRREAVLPFYFR